MKRKSAILAIINRITFRLTPTNAKRSVFIVGIVYFTTHSMQAIFGVTEDGLINSVKITVLILAVIYLTILVGANLGASDRRRRGRVLFLRRFHTETPPAFPFSSVISMLGNDGYEPVTLADTIIESDKRSNAGSALLVSMTTMAILNFIVLLILEYLLAHNIQLIGDKFQIPYLMSTMSAFKGYYMYIFVISANVVTIATSVYYRKDISMGGFKIKKMLIYRIALRIFPAKLIDLTYVKDDEISSIVRRDLRRFTYGGLAVIWSSDAQWKNVIKELVSTSDFIVVDMSNPSKNIEFEIEMLAREKSSKVILWSSSGKMDASEAFRYIEGGFKIFESSFTGNPALLNYPERLVESTTSLPERDEIIKTTYKNLLESLEQFKVNS